MARSGEQLHVGKERDDSGRAGLGRYVTTENVTTTVPLDAKSARRALSERGAPFSCPLTFLRLILEQPGNGLPFLPPISGRPCCGRMT